MAYDTWFDTDENKALLAICARKLISNIGIGGVIWGVINIALGFVLIPENILNLGVLMLGLMMLATGIQAIKSPSLGVLLTETLVTVLLFAWNVAISILNFQALGEFHPQGLIFPLIIACVFANYHRKLGHLREQIASVEPEKIKAAKQMSKKLVKMKLKNEPLVLQTTDSKCRVQLLNESAFFIQRDLMRAFVGSREDICQAVLKPDARSLKLHFNHPLGKLKYQFDKKNSRKLKDWIAMGAGPTTESNAT